MALLIILTIFALIVLATGFLGIKIPFLSSAKELKSKEKPSIEVPGRMDDNLVKRSVENTIRSTKFFREISNQGAHTVLEEC